VPCRRVLVHIGAGAFQALDFISHRGTFPLFLLFSGFLSTCMFNMNGVTTKSGIDHAAVQTASRIIPAMGDLC
jgi:hypothetical protein